MNGDRGMRGSGEGSETFERWYRAHHDRLLSQCVRTLRDRAAAEDVAQETLLRAWLGREQMREEDLGAWLSVVARNLCISHIRRQKRAVPTEMLPETPDEAADPASLVERLESRRAVHRAMRQVGERHRVLLFRREIDGVDYEDLGAELGLTPSGTRAVLFRARRDLRDRLAAAGEGLASLVAGVRVKIQFALCRIRRAVGWFESTNGPTMQTGVNIALAMGIALSSVAAPALGSLATVVGPRNFSLASTKPPAGSTLPGASTAMRSPLEKNVDSTAIENASPQDPNFRTHASIDTANNRQDVDAGGHHIDNHKQSGHSIVMEDIVQPTAAQVCHVEPQACDIGVL